MPVRYESTSVDTFVTGADELCANNACFTKFGIDRFIRVVYNGKKIKVHHQLQETPKYISEIQFSIKDGYNVCTLFYRDTGRFTVLL